MDNKKTYTKDDIVSIYFGLENHESFILSKSCFKELVIRQVEKRLFEIEAYIVDNGEIETCISAYKNLSPLQRLNKYRDIVHIHIELNDGSCVKGEAIWLYQSSNGDNRYQETELLNYRELKLRISKDLVRLNLSEVLKLPDGTIVVDEDDNEYLVEWDEDYSYLSNTLVNSKIVRSKFKVKSQII